MVELVGECCMLDGMTVKKDVFKPVYRLFPSSLSEKFSSGVLDVKSLFLVSELTHEVMIHDGNSKHFYWDRTTDFLHRTLSRQYRNLVVELLLKEGIIEVRLNKDGRETFSTTEHQCKQYRLTKDYRYELIRDEVSGMLITDHRQLKRMHTFFSRSTERLLEEHDWLKTEVEALKRLRFQKDLADRFLMEVVERQEFRGEPLTQGVYQALQKSINDADIVLNSDQLPHVSIKHGRVFHKLVNVHKEFRDFITTKTGEKLVELDMKSAQWVMLCKALAHKHKQDYTSNLIEQLTQHIEEPIHITENTLNDVRAFAGAVFFQDIYSELGLLKTTDSYAVLSGYKHPLRKLAKYESIAETLYNYFTHPEKDVTEDGWDVRSIRSVLRDTYPSVYDFLVRCAQESSSRKRSQGLAVLMQKYEGHFFHGVLQNGLKEVLEGCGYVIIHDAFFVPESKAEDALQKAKEAASEWFGDDQMFSLC